MRSKCECFYHLFSCPSLTWLLGPNATSATLSQFCTITWYKSVQLCSCHLALFCVLNTKAINLVISWTMNTTAKDVRETKGRDWEHTWSSQCCPLFASWHCCGIHGCLCYRGHTSPPKQCWFSRSCEQCQFPEAHLVHTEEWKSGNQVSLPSWKRKQFLISTRLCNACLSGHSRPWNSCHRLS